MKKIVVFFTLFLIFIGVAEAKTTLTFYEPIIEFPDVENYSLQGFTIVKDKLFIVLSGFEDTKALIKVFDLNTYEEVMEIKNNKLGHANDVTYNSKTNKIYVLAGSGSLNIHVFNGDNFKYEEKIKIDLPGRSITYIEELDKYAVRTVSNGYIYNNEFKLESKVPFIYGMNFSTDIARQGWAYYNGLIYYTNWSWKRLGGDGTNVIFIYDLDGNMKGSWYTKDDIGEIEDIAFYNERMVLGFNCYDGNIRFFDLTIPKLSKDTSSVTNSSKKTVNDNKKDNSLLFLILGFSFLGLIGIILLMIYTNKRNKI